MADAPLLLSCDCLGTMDPDAAALGAAVGAEARPRCTALCRGEAHVARAALAEAAASGRRVVVACGQEAETFAALAEEVAAETADAPALACVDVRDRAGWSDAAAEAGPKMAALLAEGMLVRPPSPVRDVVSEGVCLVLGDGAEAVEAAEKLAGTLSVTCLLGGAAEGIAPPKGGIDLALGRVVSASGAFAGFAVTVDGYASAVPGGRGALGFEPAKDGARSTCDVIVDLTGAAPLFPAAHKRDGYLRADPRDPAAVARALFDAAQLVGAFEKTLHVRLTPEICAHSRARKTGCTRCLDVCPTSAIAPDGDSVKVDPMVCAGCGACAAVCPTGAVAYDDPPLEHLHRRLRTLADAYRAAGGAAPRLLVVDAEHGAELVRLSARFGRGLPADVVPLEVAEVEGFGHAEALAALGVGFREAIVAEGPRTDLSALAPQTALAEAIAAGAGAPGRIRRIRPAEPDALEAELWAAAPETLDAEPVLPMGGRRQVARLVAKGLSPEPDRVIPLPQGAPYGAVLVNTDACTLCLACVSLCPTGALMDNPDRPELRFQEEACVQCGICAAACPERAIALEPRMDLSNAALSPRTLHEEEPFACIECGALFGVKSTIERITEKLSGKHWMFTQSDNARLIQMCDDCRVRAQYHSENSPFRLGDRPRMRTTDDDLAERAARQAERKLDD